MNTELGSRIGAARRVFEQIKSVLKGGRNFRLPVEVVAKTFSSIVSSVLLYGSEAWALSATQLHRLEVFQNSCVRQCRRLIFASDGTMQVEDSLKIPPVSVAIERKQLRFLGHIARMDPTRIPLLMQAAVRRAKLAPITVSSVLCGADGVYRKLINKYLTRANRKQFFKPTEIDEEKGRETEIDKGVGSIDYIRAPWHILAKRKGAWRKFCNEAFGN